MKKNLIKLMAILTLIAVFLTTVSAFEGFRPIFHPPTVSILDALRNDEDNFSILIGLIRESGLDELRKAGKPFTLLAPTNAAFAKLPAGSLESFKQDKNKLRQLLFNHLLPGKVLFKKMFEPDTPANEGRLTTKSLTTLGNRLTYFESTEHKAYAETVHLPLINGGARVLESDFEGNSAVIQVIDTVLLPEVDSLSSVNGDGLPVRNETASGLNTTSFDTLVGTVTVNLPDDLAAGDTISGTVIAEVKKQTPATDQNKNEAPKDEAKMQDELNGYVVEVAQQETPLKKPGDGSPVVGKKWSIPENVTSIPIVLKNREGTTIGQMKIPVSPKSTDVNKPNGSEIIGPDKPSPDPKSNPAKAAVDFFTPPIGQAGKPLSVKGPFDGDFANTAIKLGKQTAKFLASSPRKFIVESPRDLKGVSDLEVEHKGKIVAKCSYRSISVKLAADKLNLIKGEQTTLTATLAGLIGLLSPVSMQLTNKSPGTVSMEGGETQTITVNPPEVNGDIFTAKRTLTGVQAGGFAINAVVDPASSIQGNLNSCNSGNSGNLPVVPKPQPSPGETTSTPNGLDSGGNPRTNDGSGQPVNPFRARFRVTLNGFRVNHATNHGLLQRPDAVTFHPFVGTAFTDASLNPRAFSHGETNSIGMVPENRNRGGSSEPSGGFVNGDGYPDMRSPSDRLLPSSSAPLTIPPTVYFEGEIIQNTKAAWIIPNIWSLDGQNGLDLVGTQFRSIRENHVALRAAVAEIIRGPQPLTLNSYLRPGNSMGLANSIHLTSGVMQNRPIGMHSLGGNQFGFIPQVLVLTYESADFMSRNSFGFGTGIVPVRYVDAQPFGGDYTLFFQVERMDTLPPCADPISSIISGSAVLETSNRNAPGPYSANVMNLAVAFTGCRAVIQITNFPAITTLPFSITPPGGATLQNTTTVTRISGGNGVVNHQTGVISIPITLHFEHSVQTALTPFANPSDLVLELTTEGIGGRRLSGGSFVLVATGTFQGGFLGGSTGNLRVSGTFSPRP